MSNRYSRKGTAIKFIRQRGQKQITLKITCLYLIKFFSNNQKQNKKRRRRSTEKFSLQFYCYLYMRTLCSKIIDGKFQLYFRIIFKEHFEICTGVTARLSSRNLFDHFLIFLPRETYFTKQVVATHRKTVITHLTYLKKNFTPVCIVPSGRRFVQIGNMTCVSELKFSCNHNYVATILKID